MTHDDGSLESLPDDMARRWAGEDRAYVEGYLAAYPRLREDLKALFALALREVDLLAERGEPLRWDVYRKELPKTTVTTLHEYLAFEGEMDDALTGPGNDGQATFPQFPNFEVLSEIGHGGMGIVYLALDRNTKGLVAIKTLPRDSPIELVDWFKAEFRSLAELEHTNLVKLDRLFYQGRTPFFTMEYVEGVDFLEYVGQGEGRWGRLLEATRQVATGLLVLHEARKVHRDIKPSNVLVTLEGRLVILDFGLAVDQHPLPGQATEFFGETREYAAPEVRACQQATPASDWYSVGVMIDRALNSPASLTDGPGGLRAELARLATLLTAREPQARLTGPALIAAIDGLRNSGGKDSPPAPKPKLTLVGRQDELAQLRSVFADLTEAGRAGAIYVHGPSAVGKTALTEEFLRELTQNGKAVVLSGKCYRLESGPFRALDVVIDGLRRYWGRLSPETRMALLPRDAASLVRLFPRFNRIPEVRWAAERDRATLGNDGPFGGEPKETCDLPSDPQVRQGGFAALRDFLDKLSTRLRRDSTPLVLAIDDLQWGDLDSAVLLQEVLRPPDPPPLILVGCYRSKDRASAFLEYLLAQQRTSRGFELRECPVEPLGEAAAHDLAFMLLGQGQEGAVEDASSQSARWAKAGSIARQSQGLPLFIEVLVRAHSRSAERFAGEVMLADALWAEVSRLPEEARLLLEVVALAGGPIWPEDAYRAANRAEAVGRWAAMTLRKNRAILPTGAPGQPERELMEVYHDGYRQAFLLNLPRAERRAAYLRLAEAVESSDHAYEPAAKARYHLRAGTPRRAGERFAEAARAAKGGLAFGEAVRLYRAALRLTPRGLLERQLRVELAEALAHDGRGAAAAAVYLALAGDGHDPASLDLRRRAAEQFMIGGHVDRGLEIFHGVLRSADMRPPTTAWGALALLLLHRFRLRLRRTDCHNPVDPDDVAPAALTRIDICWAAIALSVIDPIRGAEFQARSLLLALRVREPYRVARTLASHASQLGAKNARTEATQIRRLLVHALKWARHVKTPTHRTHARGTITLARGIVSYLDGRWRDSVRLCDRAGKIFSKCATAGVAWEQGTARIFSLWALMYLGELSELGRRYSEQLLDEVRGRQDLYGEAILRSYVTAVALLRADDAAGARAALHDVEKLWTNSGYHTQHHNCLIARVLIDLYTGRGRDAWNYIAHRWPDYKTSHLHRVQQIRLEVISLRALTALASADADPPFFLAAAERDARRLYGECNERSTALALLIQAGVAATRRDIPQARSRLGEAIAAFDRADMALHAAAARYRLGRLDNDPGMVREAEDWMEAQGVKNRPRMAAMYTPGTWPDDPAPAGPPPNGA